MERFHYDKKGYPRWNDSNLLVHRTVNKTPTGMHTHHKDENKKNFRKANLMTLSPNAHGKLHAKRKK